MRSIAVFAFRDEAEARPWPVWEVARRVPTQVGEVLVDVFPVRPSQALEDVRAALLGEVASPASTRRVVGGAYAAGVEGAVRPPEGEGVAGVLFLLDGEVEDRFRPVLGAWNYLSAGVRVGGRVGPDYLASHPGASGFTAGVLLGLSPETVVSGVPVWERHVEGAVADVSAGVANALLFACAQGLGGDGALSGGAGVPVGALVVPTLFDAGDVHGGSVVQAARVEGLARVLEGALAGLVGALGLPAPQLVELVEPEAPADDTKDTKGTEGAEAVEETTEETDTVGDGTPGAGAAEDGAVGAPDGSEESVGVEGPAVDSEGAVGAAGGEDGAPGGEEDPAVPVEDPADEGDDADAGVEDPGVEDTDVEDPAPVGEDPVGEAGDDHDAEDTEDDAPGDVDEAGDVEDTPGDTDTDTDDVEEAEEGADDEQQAPEDTAQQDTRDPDTTTPGDPAPAGGDTTPEATGGTEDTAGEDTDADNEDDATEAPTIPEIADDGFQFDESLYWGVDCPTGEAVYVYNPGVFDDLSELAKFGTFMAYQYLGREEYNLAAFLGRPSPQRLLGVMGVDTPDLILETGEMFNLVGDMFAREPEMASRVEELAMAWFDDPSQV
ncbi:hypothetical protein C1Y63_04750 [Corynebacterium sp. 13CS0277]|uniref:hypothetical protein n=1 Tax=Corynebacterium sp. 13CS0277 TaxID=2071994 RepID=UPI000D02EC4D|nr:hypothetical protein [Corynebacterium sp. 13CS0277]PRQ11720.1 hypothetical protein C1Y63_04750 [Corynebacterium sp. 13CS0277]